jgi:two-component system chemotaxis response regulator CheY
MNDIFNSNILVVEDSEFSRAVIKGALDKMGFNNVEYPASSIEAWERIAQTHLEGKPFDLMITDLNMPGYDGVDLISQIKGDPMSRDQRIIVITSDADPSIKMICEKLGVIAYFTKPFKPDCLKDVILAILKGDEIPEVEDVI